MSKRKKNPSRDRSSSRLQQTISGLVLASALAVSLSAIAEGKTDTTAKRHYHISSGSLSHALTQFAGSAGILLSTDARLTDGKTSNGLDGDYTVEEGFKKLLAGSGLTYTITDENSVAIKVAESGSYAASTLPAVKVLGKGIYDSTDPYNEDYRLPNSSTATKTDTPIMETPFSVKAIPQQVLEDQQVIRVDKAVENVSGVIRSGANVMQRDTFTIRGFDTGDSNMYRNGVRFPQPLNGFSAQREVANLERVEVLKGPASLLYGRAEPGGVINYVTKQPLATPYYSLQQQFGSFDYYRTTADATGAINDDKSLLYRLNMAYENADSFRNYSGNEQVFVAPVLKWELSPRTRITFEMEYQDWDRKPFAYIPLINNRIPSLSTNTNLAGPNLSFNKGQRVLGGFNWSHDFNENWTLSHSFQVNNINYNAANVLFNNVSENGDTARKVGYPNVNTDTYTTSVNLIGKFNTGVLKHTSLFGFDYYKMNYRFSTEVHKQNNFNIFSPDYSSNSIFSQFPKVASFKDNQDVSWYGLYYQDQVELPNNVYLTGGVRFDESQDTALDSGTSSTKGKVSPRGGLLWRPMKELSFYGSYTENFGAFNGFDGNGHSLAPQTAQQWEVGTKTELLDGKFSATLAYYDLKKQNIAVSQDFITYSTIGAAESRGIELDVQGEIFPGWKVIGGYSYMPFAKVTQDDNGYIGGTGNRLPLAPTHSGSIWNTYEFKTGDIRGLKFGAGIVAAGQRQGNPYNDYQLPGYATVNILASYSKNIGKTKVTTQLNLDNLLDKTYYTSNGFGNEVSVLAPRTFMGSVRVEY